MHDIIVANMIATERDRFAEANVHPEPPLPFEAALRSLFARLTGKRRGASLQAGAASHSSCGECACEPAR